MDFTSSKKYLDYIMDRFYPIGADNSGGVTRLAYTKEEDMMHDEFMAIGKEEGYIVEVDEVGNSYLSIRDNKEYYLVGSHLDSVINGGRFDGVIGVAVGLLLLKIIKEKGLDIPLKVVAFRCEESSNFRKSTLGSGLITGEYIGDDFKILKSRDGKNLGDIFKSRNYNQEPTKIKGIKSYLELHIEQGRILESEDLKIGIVDVIAGNQRMKICIKGMAEHSGATPMNMRQDALCGAAEIILAMEAMAIRESNEKIVATVGELYNAPNSINVVPGEVDLSLEIRGIDNKKIKDLINEAKDLIFKICDKRKLEYKIQPLTPTNPVKLDMDLKDELSDISKRLEIKHKIMTSGAGHDAMKLANITKTGMVFIPCRAGISHNPKEEADLEDAVLGSRILLEYMLGENNGKDNIQ